MGRNGNDCEVGDRGVNVQTSCFLRSEISMWLFQDNSKPLFSSFSIAFSLILLISFYEREGGGMGSYYYGLKTIRTRRILFVCLFVYSFWRGAVALSKQGHQGTGNACTCAGPRATASSAQQFQAKPRPPSHTHLGPPPYLQLGWIYF